jgi:FkbM family methyltransferase
MMRSLKRLVKQFFRIFGIEVRRTQTSNHFPNTLVRALRHFEIDTVFDVGANVGQFASGLRQAGFKGRIVSFEPLSEAHAKLCERAKRDPHWIVHPRGALGDRDGMATINVAGNSVSSSVLDMKESHSSAAQDSDYVGCEAAAIHTLDSVADQYLEEGSKVFLKIDTQGFEWQVLDGTLKTMPRIHGILLEVSLVELYTGQRLWKDMIERLEVEGFTVWSVDRGFTDPRDGRTLQLDIGFFRE